MANNTRSRYQTIWDTLKRDKIVRVTAPLAAHARLKEAVKKRKKRDLGYKLLLGEEEKVAILWFSTVGTILEVKLLISTRSTWL